MMMSGMVTSLRIPSSCSKSFLTLIPPLRERVDAAWITGPSARGSLNGMPISIMSTPLRWSERMTSAVQEGVGSPAQKYIERISLVFVLNKLSIRFIMFVFYGRMPFIFSMKLLSFPTSFKAGDISKPLFRSMPANCGWKNAFISSKVSERMPPLRRNGTQPL